MAPQCRKIQFLTLVMNINAFFGWCFGSMTTVSHKPATSRKDRQAYRDMFEILVD
jgi:hypothetical protein